MRILGTIIGLAIFAGGGFLIYKVWFTPESESTGKSNEILTGAYEPQLAECRILEDAELPRGIEAPKLGSDTLYLLVVVLYPGAASSLQEKAYFLARVNDVANTALKPIHTTTEYVAEEGTYLELIYKITEDFEYAQLILEGKAVLPRVEIQ